MATQSIMKNITITEPVAAEVFISAMEKAADSAENSDYCYAESEDLGNKHDAIPETIQAAWPPYYESALYFHSNCSEITCDKDAV